MSYSYIKNVFPDFETSEHNRKVFNSLNLDKQVASKSTNPEVVVANTKRIEPQRVEDTRNNLMFYNQPLPKREHFENTCDEYAQHIFTCQRCRNMVLKQLNVDRDKARNEEIMEIVSYIVFGLFILMLLDNIQK
jgi:hypothetical protein